MPVLERLEMRSLFSVSPVVLATLPGPVAAGVAVDAAGNVYGTTGATGDSAGTVFEIPAGTSAPRTLATFGPADPATNTLGINPRDVRIDAAGNLFGSTASGGVADDGTRPAAGRGGTLWTLPAGGSAVRRLATFTGGTPFAPDYGPTLQAIDAADDSLFGSVQSYATHPSEYLPVVYERLPDGPLGYVASFTNQTDPVLLGNVAADPGGSAYVLYRSVQNAGLLREVPAGTVGLAAIGKPFEYPFDLAKFVDAPGQGAGQPVGVAVGPDKQPVVTTTSNAIVTMAVDTTTPAVRATLDPAVQGSAFYGNPTLDAAGDVFAVTSAGGPNGFGTLLELPAGGSVPVVLLPFDTASAYQQAAGFTLDAAGNLFGTRPAGSDVAVFELPGVGPKPTPAPAATTTLTPTIIRSTLARAVISGTRARPGVVVIRVVNSGTTTTTGTVTVDLYAKAIGTADGAGTRVGSTTRRLRLPAGRSVALAVRVPSLQLGAGTYTVLPAVTAADGTVTTSIAGEAVTVAAPVVDLTAAIGRIAPTALRAGRPLTVTVVATNRGNIDARRTLSITLGLSTDGGMTLAVPFTPIIRRAVVRAGRSASLRLRAPTPTTVPAGTYTVVATVISGEQVTRAIGATPVTFG